MNTGNCPNEHILEIEAYVHSSYSISLLFQAIKKDLVGYNLRTLHFELQYSVDSGSYPCVFAS